MTPRPSRPFAIVPAALLGILSLAAARTGAQAPSRAGQPSARPRPVAVAAPRTGPIALDGRLDDAAWATATPITTFTQQKPVEGAAPGERTEVRFLYDDEAIYVGARMYESRGPAGVTSRLVRRDDDVESDVLRIDFDTYHDRLHSVEFDVNPAGWRGDATDYDRSWDPVWQAASNVDSLGWSTEIRIPFSQLRFSRDTLQVWGLNVTRITHRNQERSLWAYWGQNDAGGPSYFGDLTGIVVRRAPQRAEFLPYVVARQKKLGTADRNSPFYAPNARDLRLGGDVKYLLTNSFTLSATVNPDFGQVEVDPAVVNLSAFETYFPEKRPFFVEGSSLFDFGNPGCNINCHFGLYPFYSRRVGRSPQGASIANNRGDFADVPENTTILGAAKLTGRTKNGYSVGLLDAVTQRAVAEVDVGGTIVKQPVEPTTNSFAGRVTRDLRGGNLVLGTILTAENRSIGDSAIATLLPRASQTAGVDVKAYWDRHNWTFYGAIAATNVTGDSGAILRAQRSSARFLQRPDRPASSNGFFTSAYDPSLTAMRGYGAIARLSKEGGSWVGDLNASTLSPGYEANDLGFVTMADYRWLNGTVGRRYTKPTSWYQNAIWLFGSEQYWNHEGDVTQRDATLIVQGTLKNYWDAFVGVMRATDALDDRKTRGGPVVGTPGATIYLGRLGTDPRRAVGLSGNTTLQYGDDGSSDESVDFSINWKAAPNVLLSIGPTLGRSKVTDQYVKSVSDSTATTFFGRRYVFSHLDQRQVAMSTRASVTFTPSLSLDLFAQPLIASGGYHNFEEFAAPRTQRKLVYGRDVGTISSQGDGADKVYTIDPDGTGPAKPFTVDNPDFNFRSLRGTAVLRWEWRPGSTAYLVWTQTRSGEVPIGNLVVGRDEHALFRTPSDNIFVLKISYWLAR